MFSSLLTSQIQDGDVTKSFAKWGRFLGGGNTVFTLMYEVTKSKQVNSYLIEYHSGVGGNFSPIGSKYVFSNSERYSISASI
jgi:hypothetical protein